MHAISPRAARSNGPITELLLSYYSVIGVLLVSGRAITQFRKSYYWSNRSGNSNSLLLELLLASVQAKLPDETESETISKPVGRAVYTARMSVVNSVAKCG